MESFTSQVDNTCKLKLHLPLEIVNTKIFYDLSKKYEISGVINFDQQDQVININKNKGNADSVYTPNNVINFHTHPISAYNQGNTVWGWPSGEDIRETIKFSLGGNKTHLVFTVEGLYTIQISPCKLRKMKQLLTSEERGVLIFAIEHYFKCTHNFRGVDEVNNLSKNNIFINPYSFVDFANTFQINNLLSQKETTYKKCELLDIKKIGHTGIHSEENNNIIKYAGIENHSFSKIPNMGFPEIVEVNNIKCNKLKNYILPEDLNDVCSINNRGIEGKFKCKLSEIIKKLNKISTSFNEVKCKTIWNNNPNAWFFVNFFPSNYYINKNYFIKNKYITPPNKNNIIFLHYEPFIRIFSNRKEGCSINTIGKNNKFEIGKKIYNSFGKSNNEITYLLNLYKIIN